MLRKLNLPSEHLKGTWLVLAADDAVRAASAERPPAALQEAAAAPPEETHVTDDDAAIRVVELRRGASAPAKPFSLEVLR